MRLTSTDPVVDARPGPTARELAVVAAGLVALALIATLPLALHFTTYFPNDLGDPVLNAWILWWDATAIGNGLRHLWDAPTYFPYDRTLAYSDHLLGIALFTAPLQWLTGNAVLVYNVAFIASYANAGLGMYLLARSLTGRRDAAAVAALIYAFSAFRIAHFAHIQWLMTGWLPLSLWALHRYFATGAWKYLLASGAFYVVQCLTANYFAYFGLLPLAAIGIVETWRRRPPLGRLVVHVMIVAFLAGLVLAPIAHVYYRVRQENDFRRTPDEIQRLSADLSDYLRGHNRIWLWRHARRGTGEHELFPGAVALLLTVAALATKRARATPNTTVYAALAAVALILSLGPHPTAWGHRSPIAGPYQLLLSTVPGLDGLRAVSRMGLLVIMAVSVLSAYGAAVLFDRVGGGRRWVLVLLTGVLILTESWAVPVRTAAFDPIPDAGDRQAYEFLRQSAPGAALELPFASDDEAQQMTYQYLTLMHGHRTVNGHSSYDPPLLRLLAGRDQCFDDSNHLGPAVELIRALGVRYVVLHRDDYGRGIEAALIHELDNGHIETRHDFGRTSVFTLKDDERTTDDGRMSRLVPRTALRARSSHSPDRLPLLFDGNRDSRWLSAGRQTGREWIEIALDAPRDIARVRMQTAERSFGDYPRELAIDVVEADGVRTLFQGSILPQFGRGFLVDHAYPYIDVVLPANRAGTIRLRQVGTTDELFWSIHELELWERPPSLGRTRDELLGDSQVAGID